MAHTDQTAPLCLFGGAFDPPHTSHARLIRTALDRLPIDRLIVLPSGLHPHKRHRGAVDPSVRVELCRLAFGDIEGVRVDDWDARQPEPCYTVETLQHFREYETAGRRPYWLIGADNLRLLPSWHRHHDVLRMAVLVTFPRAGYPVDPSVLDTLELTATERRELKAHVLDGEPDGVSATDIRARLRRGEATQDLLHPAVEARIRALGLYGAGG